VRPRHLLPALLVVLGVAYGARAESTGGTISRPLPSDALPVPPPRTEQVLSSQGFAPAPVPDLDLQRPRADVLADQPRTQVLPNLTKRPDRPNGDGFVDGSAGTYDPAHRFRASPGINLTVPLQ
jgi:hypothetical protein